jgi:conjugative relaxase-like TrwC/TraI family protein
MSIGMSARAVVLVMRVTTLKATGDQLGGLLAYYAGLAEDRGRPGPARGPVDYYLDPDEPPGRWWGSGRHALGLDGTVAGGDLRALLEGAHPQTGSPLGRRFGDRSARAFDATFSAPKSVSVLWALTPDPWVRAEVLAAHDAAVDAALEWFERHGAVTRLGTDGAFQVDTVGVTAALFRQHTSRAMDPQLHTHAIIAAKIQEPSGRWLSLDARFLKFQQRSIGAIYDAALRAELTRRVGVAWTERGPGVIDLACVSDAVRETFSKRSGQVDDKLTELIRRWSDDHDGAVPDARTIASLERSAAFASRPAKLASLDSEVLRAEWAWEATRSGVDVSVLTARQLGDGGAPRFTGRVPDDDLIDEALIHASEEASTWLRADLARHLAQVLEADHAPGAESLVTEVDRLAALAEERCVPLGPEPVDTARRRADGRPLTEHVTDRRFTTPAILRQEQGLQAWAAVSTRPRAAPEDSQAAAARAIAAYDPLVIVVGPAGTGKTHVTARAVADLHRQHRPVVGLAPSGKAADILAGEAGCPTDTVAGFLTRHHDRPSRWPAGTTVVLDEAAMTSTPDLARLVDLVRVNRWRLVAVGDPQQLPSVARGGVFAHWCDTIPHHTLEEPRRFTHQWEAAASLGLRAGRPDAAEVYAAHGRLHATHPALIPSRVAAAHHTHIAEGRSVAITTSSAETARAINREIQRHNQRRGRRVTLHDATDLYVGDQIATRRNDPTLRTERGERVRNRHIWTVTAISEDGRATVTHPRRGSVELPADFLAEYVELGWAVTGYGTQSDTVDVGIAVLESSTTRNHAYVAMTRGREANHAILVDPTGLDDPAQRLAEMIARPAHGESALALQARLLDVADVGAQARGLVPTREDDVSLGL